MQRQESELEHGVNAYAAKECRCKVCRGAWADYMRERQHRLGRRTRAQYLSDLRAARPQKVGRQLRCYYPGKQRTVIMQLTPLGVGLLEGAQRRTGRSRGDIVERLLRQHGGKLEFDEAAAS